MITGYPIHFSLITLLCNTVWCEIPTESLNEPQTSKKNRKYVKHDTHKVQGDFRFCFLCNEPIYSFIRRNSKKNKNCHCGFVMLNTVSTFHWLVSFSTCVSSSPCFFHWFVCHSLLCDKSSQCCILRGPGGERILHVVPRGTELGTRLRRWVGKAAHTLNNPQVECTGALLCLIRE